MSDWAMRALLLQVFILPPPDAERVARVAAVRSLSAYYFDGKTQRVEQVLCLAIDNSSVTGEPLPDDNLPDAGMLTGEDDDPVSFYLKSLSSLRARVVPFSKCPKKRWRHDGLAFGPVTVRLRPVRWVGVDTIEIPTIATKASDPWVYTKAFRYVWVDNAWQERPFSFVGERCPY